MAPRSPARSDCPLASIRLRPRDPTEGDVATLLESVAEIRYLSLRGTPVTESILAVVGRLAPRHLDLVDTGLGPEALSRFRADHPMVSVLPAAARYDATMLSADGRDHPYSGRR